MKHTYFLAAALCAALCFSGCGAKENTLQRYTDTSLDVFDTVTVITGYDETEEAFSEKKNAVLAELESYHRLYDIYNDYDGINNIKTVNDNAGIAPVQVDDKIIDLIQMSIDVYTLTEGKTNIAMGSVLSLWHEAREDGLAEPENAYLPDMAELREASLHTDINNIIVDASAKTVYLSDPEMSLDVGATAKGYATEMCAEMCEERGWTSYALSIGGNVRTIGTKPGGESWNIGIQNPDDLSGQTYFEKVRLDSMSLVTSGSYQRFYTVSGVRYHHIIDPDTLMPENNFVSVSVICENSGLGDALSTALFNMSADDGRALVESLDNTEAVWMLADGSTFCTAGFEALVVDVNL